LELLQPVARDAAARKPVLLEDLEQGLGGATRADRLFPPRLTVGGGNRLQLAPGGELRLLHAALVDPAFREKSHAETHAAHVARFQQQRLEALADDELGGAAAD